MSIQTLGNETHHTFLRFKYMYLPLFCGWRRLELANCSGCVLRAPTCSSLLCHVSWNKINSTKTLCTARIILPDYQKALNWKRTGRRGKSRGMRVVIIDYWFLPFHYDAFKVPDSVLENQLILKRFCFYSAYVPPPPPRYKPTPNQFHIQ